jgi:AcrR family transcriptional regulator
LTLEGFEPTPSGGWPPTACGILEASKRLLIEKGYEGLRFEAIEKESGSNKSMIRYYFGSKEGLVAALFDEITHDLAVGLLGMVGREPSAQQRVRNHLVSLLGLIDPPSEFFTRYYDILPHAFRDEELRSRMVELFRWHRQIEVKCFGGPEASLDDPDLNALGSIVMAAVDGLGIQVALEDPSFDAARAWRIFQDMVDCYLEKRAHAE